jgi:hypothetical protein
MEDRLSPMMLTNKAHDFWQAAAVVNASGAGEGFTPTYFLCAQSIELSLKGYLRGRGKSKEELKKLGHDLMATLAAANNDGLPDLFMMTEEDFGAIVLIASAYKAKELQYTEAGYKRYPQAKYLLALTEKLWRAVRPFCVENRTKHHGKPTVVP